LVADKQLLPTCFSLLTISQNIFVMIITQLVGYIREKTGNYTGVSFLMSCMNLFTMYFIC